MGTDRFGVVVATLGLCMQLHKRFLHNNWVHSLSDLLIVRQSQKLAHTLGILVSRMFIPMVLVFAEGKSSRVIVCNKVFYV